MKHRCSSFITIILFISAYTTCKATSTDSTEINIPVDIHMTWNYGSIQQITDKSAYPRLLRLKDNSIIVIYETCTRDIAYRRSYDNGKACIEPITVFPHSDYSNDKGESARINMANSEAFKIRNMVEDKYYSIKRYIATMPRKTSNYILSNPII